jgi:C4-dicarboxylate transporter DctQ subunit
VTRAAGFLRGFNRVLDRLEETLIASFMATATLVIFAAVCYRYTASISWIWQYTSRIDMTWAQELCIYLFIWMAKFGAAYGVRTGIHVGVDVVVNHVSERNRRFLILFGLSAGAFFTAVIASLGGWFVYEVNQTGQVSPDLEMPMWIVYLAIPLGSGLMCLRFLQVAWRFRRTNTLPKHDVTRIEGVDPYEPADAQPVRGGAS